MGHFDEHLAHFNNLKKIEYVQKLLIGSRVSADFL